MPECAQRRRKPLAGLTPSAGRLLLNARWDGNVRELRNAIERACILVDGTMISERELAGAIGAEPAAPPRLRAGDPVPPRRDSTPAALEQLERAHIVDVLRQVNGNRMAAAKVLG